MNDTLQNLIELTGHTPADFATLGAYRDRTRGWCDDVVRLFYDTLFAYPPTQAVFAEGERPAREKTLHDWLAALLAGTTSETFWQQQWIVGLLHIKRHVGNSFMLGMISRIQVVVLERALRELGPEDGAKLFVAFKRITDVITGLIAEGYHRGYKDAVADVTGMKEGLIDRMADVAVGRLLDRARAS